MALRLAGDTVECSPGCGRSFGSVAAYFEHRIGRSRSRRCMLASEMIDRGLRVGPDNVWRLPAEPREAAN